jgi:Uma2 family endonuclease
MRTAFMTAGELLRLDLHGQPAELIRGRLVVREPAGARHGAVAMELGSRIAAHVRSHDLGRVYAAETGFKLESDPYTVRAPDVAFIVKHRLPDEDSLGFPSGAPDLAVEVVAQDDRPAATLAKVAQWLEAGARLVWVVDCVRRSGHVYRADGTESLLEDGGALLGEDLLPGFRCPLSELW